MFRHLFLFVIFLYLQPLMAWSMSSTDQDPASILIVRGWTRGKAHNQSLIDLVQKNRSSWQVESIDIPGNGSRNNEVSFASIDQNTDFLRTHWMKSALHKKRVIIGISLGGMIVLDWMKRYPEDFEHFIVVNSSQSNFCSLWERVKLSNLGNLLTIASPLSSELTKEEAIRDMSINIRRNDETLIQSWVSIRKSRPVVFMNVLRQMWAGFRFKFESEKPSHKLHVIVSTNDNMVSSACSERLASFFEAPLSVHPTAGHDLANDDPAWFIEKVGEVLL